MQKVLTKKYVKYAMTINSKLGQLTLNKANKKLKSTKNFSMSTRRKNLPKKKKKD